MDWKYEIHFVSGADSRFLHSSLRLPRNFSVRNRWTQEENLLKGVKLILIKNPRRDWSEMSRWKIKELFLAATSRTTASCRHGKRYNSDARVFHLKGISRRGDHVEPRAGRQSHNLTACADYITMQALSLRYRECVFMIVDEFSLPAF